LSLNIKSFFTSYIQRHTLKTTAMKTKVMMITLAVAALLIGTESIEAQSRVVTRSRSERRNSRVVTRTDPQPRRGERSTVIVQEVVPVRIKIVDNEVIRAFERETFDSNRLRMAEMVFSTGGYMTTAQIKIVSQSFDFDNDRVKFLKLAFDNCVDRHNFYRVLSTVEFSSSREKIIKYAMESQLDDVMDGAALYEVSSSDMTAIIKTLKNERFDSMREKLGKMIVSGSVLTSRQIADMARTFQFDSNRSEFLQFAYRNCSDPQNYVIAANTLEFSSSRNELMRKISRRP